MNQPPMNADQRRLDEITEKIIGCAFTVSNVLGAGFVEKVYENALALELRAADLSVVQQHPIAVRYKGVVVGEFVADLLVAGEVLVELKAIKSFDEAHSSQCMNHLRGTGLHVCLLFNFGKPRVELKRIVLGF
jgi:GxxExxY protein